MSDLFKRQRPKLTEDEERALWERVRTLPREVGSAAARGPARSWWRGLFAVPAVRFGAPALAVALVAVVWVVQQSPTPPARERAVAMAPVPAPVADAPAPVATVGGEDAASGTMAAPPAKDVPSAANLKAEAPVAELESAAPAPAPADGREQAPTAQAKESMSDVRQDESAAEERRESRMAAPPPAAQPPTSWGSVRSQYRTPDSDRTLATQKVRAADAPGFIDPNRLAGVLQLAGGEVVLETVRLPISGGLAWIAAGAALEGTLALGDGAAERDVYYVFPEMVTTWPREIEATVVPAARVARVAVIAGPANSDLRARFIDASGNERETPAPRTSARSRRAALGVELLLAFRTGELGPLERVRDEALRLAAANPGDAGARSLVSWCEEAIVSRRAAGGR